MLAIVNKTKYLLTLNWKLFIPFTIIDDFSNNGINSKILEGVN
jgi:hypothetical protein